VGVVPAPRRADEAGGALPRGGVGAPGRGRADGDALGAARGRGDLRGPRFDVPLPRDGYAWWYVDVVSDDGETTLVLIALLGSVFSPFYAAARRRGPTEPLAHVSLHVALYRKGASRWSLNERDGRDAARSVDSLELDASALWWDGGALHVEFREETTPFWASLRRGVPLRGRVRLVPEVATPGPIALDDAGAHRWWPSAAAAHAEVVLDEPRLRFTGRGYHDANEGDEPLERRLQSWRWQRAAPGPGESLVHYDVQERSGATRHVGLALRGATVAELPAGSAVTLPRSGWGLAREAHGPLVRAATLEDTPFYARSRLQAAHGGRSIPWVHEQLCLDRFASGWVQRLLPFRTRRAS